MDAKHAERESLVCVWAAVARLRVQKATTAVVLVLLTTDACQPLPPSSEHV